LSKRHSTRVSTPEILNNHQLKAFPDTQVSVVATAHDTVDHEAHPILTNMVLLDTATILEVVSDLVANLPTASIKAPAMSVVVLDIGRIDASFAYSRTKSEN
jgi:hypothetical protein